MARPIRPTPILFGKDAERFFKEISKIPPIEERRKERARIEKSVEELLSTIERMQNEEEKSLQEIDGGDF